MAESTESAASPTDGDAAKRATQIESIQDKVGSAMHAPSIGNAVARTSRVAAVPSSVAAAESERADLACPPSSGARTRIVENLRFDERHVDTQGVNDEVWKNTQFQLNPQFISGSASDGALRAGTLCRGV